MSRTQRIKRTVHLKLQRRVYFDAFQEFTDAERAACCALINRIRLSSSPAVLAEAEHLLRRITEQYFSTNLTVEELSRLARSEDADPLRSFGEACRAELKTIRARI